MHVGKSLRLSAINIVECIIGASILAGLSLAGTTELIQGLLTYRSMDLADFFADMIGLLSGAALTGAIVAIKRK